MASVQTKFNYAWVRSHDTRSYHPPGTAAAPLMFGAPANKSVGPREIQLPC